jgi:hypothetical protein
VSWTGLVWLRIGTGESSCERGNEPSGCIKCWETFEWLHSWWPVEWYSAPQSYIYIYIYIYIFMRTFTIQHMVMA